MPGKGLWQLAFLVPPAKQICLLGNTGRHGHQAYFSECNLCLWKKAAMGAQTAHVVKLPRGLVYKDRYLWRILAELFLIHSWRINL